MIKRSKPKKRSKKMRLKVELDALVRQKVFERDGNKCVRCGATGALTPSHVLPKGRYQNLRWLEINILTLDVACHLYWWHLNPVESAEWFRKTFPDRWRDLMALKDIMPTPDMVALKAELS